MSQRLAMLHEARRPFAAALRRLLLPVMAIASLSGCLSQPAKQETKPVPLATSAAPVIAVAPEVRSDFDAAMARMNAGEYQQGIELLDKVIARAPKLSVPYVNRAIAQVKLGNLKAAEDDLKHALELEPANPVANNEYGLLYRKTGRFAEARKLYESLLASYPYYPIVHKNLGILCDLYLRDYECALREYEVYAGAAPDDKTIKIWIADVQRRLGK
jgi:tetratricopeptide (TPR) repeat protein